MQKPSKTTRCELPSAGWLRHLRGNKQKGESESFFLLMIQMSSHHNLIKGFIMALQYHGLPSHEHGESIHPKRMAGAKQTINSTFFSSAMPMSLTPWCPRYLPWNTWRVASSLASADPNSRPRRWLCHWVAHLLSAWWSGPLGSVVLCLGLLQGNFSPFFFGRWSRIWLWKYTFCLLRSLRVLVVC